MMLTTTSSSVRLLLLLFFIYVSVVIAIASSDEHQQQGLSEEELSVGSSDASSSSSRIVEQEAEIDSLGQVLHHTTAAAVATAKNENKQETIQTLEQQAFQAMNTGERETALELWRQVLQLDPRSGNAHVQLGLAGLFSTDYAQQAHGVVLMERAFNETYVDSTIPMPSEQGIMILGIVGRWRWERAEYDLAAAALRRAWAATGKRNVCLATQIATMLHPYPRSTQHADEMMDLYIRKSTYFLEKLQQHPTWRIDQKQLIQQFGGAAEDPYVHCLLTIFHLSFYYRADVARAANLHFEIATTLWPELRYVAPRYRNNNWQRPTAAAGKPCVPHGQKIRLGVASGALSQHHSVSSDFKGVLSQLDRQHKFEVTYIYFQEREHAPVDAFVYRNPQDRVILLQKRPDEEGDNEIWLSRYRKTIEELDLDVLLYLDLTMSSHGRRVGMAKLAAVQATTHGHPLTSGIPRDIVDYYISWEAAELDYETASTHYTEELVLLPKEVPHQFYKKRSNTTHSLIDGMEYQSLLDRTTFYDDDDGRRHLHSPNPPPAHANWYVCMQKPHKFQPEVDELFCNVLSRDPDGILVLHREERSDLNQQQFAERLAKAGCEMNRIFFSGSLPHHRLLALYAMADVVLDSYPAGGCTSTREVLELGKVVVTLPARLLGGRWSYAYYTILADTELMDMVVANSVQDYVDKAVRLGRNETHRKNAEQRVRDSLPRLYGRKESIESWEKVLLDIAPVSFDKETCIVQQ